MERLKTRIVVDIDSLFDMRQAKLAYVAEANEAFFDYINSDDYNLRDNDTDIDALCDVKNLDVLAPYMVITFINHIVKKSIDRMEIRNAVKNKSAQAEVIVNYYPYDVSPSVLDKIRDGLFVKWGRKCFIEFTSIDVKSFTPFYILNADVGYLFTYRFSEWLNGTIQSLEKTPLTETILYTPALLKENPSEEDLKLLSKSGFRDFFSYFEFILSRHIAVRFLPVPMYSNELNALRYISSVTPENIRETIDSIERPSTEGLFSSDSETS